MHSTRYKGQDAIFRTALPSFSYEVQNSSAYPHSTLLIIVQQWVLGPAEWPAGKAVSQVALDIKYEPYYSTVRLQRGAYRYFLTISIAAACSTRQPEGAHITEIINLKQALGPALVCYDVYMSY